MSSCRCEIAGSELAAI